MSKEGNSIKNIYLYAIICAAALFLLPLARESAESTSHITATIIPIVLFIICLLTSVKHGFSIALSVIILVLSIISLKMYGSDVLGPQSAGYFLVALAGNMIGNMIGNILRGQKGGLNNEIAENSETNEDKEINEDNENPM